MLVQSRKEKTYKRVSLYLPCVPKATARRALVEQVTVVDKTNRRTTAYAPARILRAACVRPPRVQKKKRCGRGEVYLKKAQLPSRRLPVFGVMLQLLLAPLSSSRVRASVRSSPEVGALHGVSCLLADVLPAELERDDRGLALKTLRPAGPD